MSLKNSPILIAGPCSAESKEQVLQTAIALKEKTTISMFRAGLWKPRTRPGQFEGVGSKGLAWLEEVKKQTSLAVCTEVGTTKHVEDCLTYNIDAFWIGTRTTSSPFAISELAEVLKGTSKSILIKNPVNPDLNLWIGAIERFQNAGVENISIVHRGFSTLNNKPYRYNPCWDLVSAMLKECPDIPMILDPSHIAGKADEIQTVIDQAKNIRKFKGYMIESHLNPTNALTDQAQQITPSDLADLSL